MLTREEILSDVFPMMGLASVAMVMVPKASLQPIIDVVRTTVSQAANGNDLVRLALTVSLCTALIEDQLAEIELEPEANTDRQGTLNGLLKRIASELNTQFGRE